MPKPQQPELRRSDYGATSDDSAKAKVGMDDAPTDEAGAHVPEDNQPGHHPEREQDKPDPEAFIERARGAGGGQG
ncbi:MAG: hypothetical protein M3P97_11760 [Actinomycetota bacterium]|jgi:hypothetical protein|nr:hypothetical protein [Actinomycetota bacterium]